MAHRQPSEYRFESEVQADLLAHFGALPWLRIWRNNVGKAYPVGQASLLKQGKSCRPVMFGVVGSADIMGILVGGRALAIEVKLAGQKLRPEQIAWRDMFVRFGGLHIVATCIEDVYRGLEAEGVKCR